MIYYYVITCFIPILKFFTISFGDCQSLQWRLVLVWSLGTEVLPAITLSAPNIIIFPRALIKCLSSQSWGNIQFPITTDAVL